MFDIMKHNILLMGAAGVAGVEAVQHIPVAELQEWLKLAIQLVIGVFTILQQKKQHKKIE